MDRHAADYDRYHADAEAPDDDTPATIHRDVDGDGTEVQHDGTHVHMINNPEGDRLFTPTVARAVAADLLAAADAIEGETTPDLADFGELGYAPTRTTR